MPTIRFSLLVLIAATALACGNEENNESMLNEGQVDVQLTLVDGEMLFEFDIRSASTPTLSCPQIEPTTQVYVNGEKVKTTVDEYDPTVWGSDITCFTLDANTMIDPEAKDDLTVTVDQGYDDPVSWTIPSVPLLEVELTNDRLVPGGTIRLTTESALEDTEVVINGYYESGGYLSIYEYVNSENDVVDFAVPHDAPPGKVLLDVQVFRNAIRAWSTSEMTSTLKSWAAPSAGLAAGSDCPFESCHLWVVEEDAFEATIAAAAAP